MSCMGMQGLQHLVSLLWTKSTAVASDFLPIVLGWDGDFISLERHHSCRLKQDVGTIVLK